MASREISLYEWIEAALQISKPCCQVHKKTRLQLVWLTDEQGELFDWYIECSVCNREYGLSVGFYPINIPQK